MAWSPPSDTAPNLDSGHVAIPTAFANIGTASVQSWLLGCVVSNIRSDGAAAYFTLADTAGNALIYQQQVAPGYPVNLQFAFMPTVGVKWIASTSPSLVGRVWGRV